MAVDYVKRSSAAYRAAQQTISRQAVAVVDRAWKRVDRADIDRSWAAVRGSVVDAVAAGQARSAAAVPLLSDRVLAADGLHPDPLDTVSPLAFAGYTADGVDLGTVLDSSTTYAKLGIARGQSPADALAAAQRRLDLITATEVADAGRGAMDAQLRLDPQFIGYERHVNLPCCSRCLILAGRIYKTNEGFLRHPQCDCFHVPVTSRDQHPEQEPSALFHSLTDAQQDAAFTPEGARAIRDGASISSVVNARWRGGVRGKTAGMSRPGDPYTTVRAKGAKGRRLSPQGVALKAGDDTKLYRQLLRDHGYIR